MLLNIKLILFSTLLVIASDCNGTKDQEESKPVTSKEDTETISFVTLLSTSHSNVKEATQQVITSEEGLEEIYALINSTKTPNDPVPKVDFSTQEVFFYTPGEVSHGVAGIQVATVSKIDNKIIVRLKGSNQDPSGYATTVMSQPAVLIQYEKQGLPVQVKMAQEE